MRKLNVKQIHIRLHGFETEFNKIFPPEILKHENDKMLAYALLNQ